MIVKNEAHVIKRCLGSVKPWIDHWTIVDTGSNDGTQSLVREVLCDIPGSLFERPWIDFSVNRSESIALASPFSDYLLIIDADDTLEVESKFAFPLLSRDAYTLTVHDAGHLYRRLHIIRTSLPWRYEGVLHEYLECSKPYNSGHISNVNRTMLAIGFILDRVCEMPAIGSRRLRPMIVGLHWVVGTKKLGTPYTKLPFVISTTIRLRSRSWRHTRKQISFVQLGRSH